MNEEPGGMHDHVCADAGLPLPGVVQNSQRQANDQKNERDLERDRDNADNRPNRPVHQVGDNHLVHHVRMILCYAGVQNDS